MKNLFLCIAAAVLLTSCIGVSVSQNCHGYTQSGVEVKESRRVSGFSSVELRSCGDVRIHQGQDFALEVEADQNMLPFVRTYVENGVLIVDNDKCNCGGRLSFDITMPRIQDFKIMGSGSLAFPGGISLDDFCLHIMGSGSAFLQGTAGSLDVRISGAGNVKACGLEAASVSVGISGSGEVEVCASKSLDVKISGAGNVKYTGAVSEISQSISGAGQVSRI